MATKHEIKSLRGLQCNLSMVGISILVPSYFYNDNVYIIHNNQCPESMLKNKSNYTCVSIQLVSQLQWGNL